MHSWLSMKKHILFGIFFVAVLLVLPAGANAQSGGQQIQIQPPSSQQFRGQGFMFGNDNNSSVTVPSDGSYSSTTPNDGIYSSMTPSDPNSTSTASNGQFSGLCNNSFTTFADILNFGSCIINSALIQIAITFAVVYFIWGVVQYVLSADNMEERKKSKQIMLWGILAIFVIVSVWGIINFFRTTFGF
jgi:hypothetical protein